MRRELKEYYLKNSLKNKTKTSITSLALNQFLKVETRNLITSCINVFKNWNLLINNAFLKMDFAEKKKNIKMVIRPLLMHEWCKIYKKY